MTKLTVRARDLAGQENNDSDAYDMIQELANYADKLEDRIKELEDRQKRWCGMYSNTTLKIEDLKARLTHIHNVIDDLPIDFDELLDNSYE